jgi:uncharacterized protein YjbI with pentapeptide repeats
MPRDPQGQPIVPASMPSYDDPEPLGFSYFCTGREDADRRNLTLRRTYFGRSLLERVDFRNTDLSESRMCWNDFVGCDFSGADLSGCDMRASLFRDCKFVGTILSHADLRRSAFQGCDFTVAVLTGAVADYYRDEYDLAELLTKEQQAVMDWRDDPGPQPSGG